MKELENLVWTREQYNIHWRGYNSPRRVFEYEQKILSLLPRDKEIKIVDIGCGIGRLMNQIWHKGYKNIEGIDISDVAITVLNKRYPYLKGKVADATKIDFSSYDLAIVTEVIEHLEDDLCLKLPKNWIASVPNGDTIAKSHVRSYLPEDIKSRFNAEVFFAGKWIIFGNLEK